VLPVKEICTLAHGKGLWVVLDGAQAVGMCPTDVRDYGCDAYSTSGHKWLLGPKGTGLLYVRENMLDVIEPIMVGAYSDNGFDLLKGNMSYHPTAQRYEYGTVSSPLMVGVGSAIDFLESIGLQNTWNRNRALSTCLVDGLSEMKGVDVLTPMRDSERGAMVSFKLRNVEISKLQSFLAEKCKLRTRGVGEANLNALRISTHIYNNFEEVGRVVEGVKAATNL
jgi:selenocysteine lyase/cysteine desulfurase